VQDRRGEADSPGADPLACCTACRSWGAPNRCDWLAGEGYSNFRRCGQGIQVGLRYAGQILSIEVDETTLRVHDQCERLIKTVPRTSRKEVRRHKAYGHTNQKTS
jgi:hypothetical protein